MPKIAELDPHTIEPTEFNLEGGSEIELDAYDDETGLMIESEETQPISNDETNDIISSVIQQLESSDSNPKSDSESNSIADKEDKDSLDQEHVVKTLNPNLHEKINQKEILEPAEVILFDAWNKIYHHNSRIYPGTDTKPINSIFLSDFGIFPDARDAQGISSKGIHITFNSTEQNNYAVLRRASRNTNNQDADQYDFDTTDMVIIEYEVVTSGDNKLRIEIHDVLYEEHSDSENLVSLTNNDKNGTNLPQEKIQDIEMRYLEYHPNRTEYANLKLEYDKLRDNIAEMTSELEELRKRALEIEQAAAKKDIDLNNEEYEGSTGTSTLSEHRIHTETISDQESKLTAYPVAEEPEPIPEGLSPNPGSLEVAKQIEEDVRLMEWYVQYRLSQGSANNSDLENLTLGNKLISDLETQAAVIINKPSSEFTPDDLDILNKARDKVLKTIGVDPQNITQLRTFKEISETESETREQLLDKLGFELWLPREVEANGEDESQETKDLAFEIINLYQEITKGNLNLIPEYRNKIENLRAMKLLSNAQVEFKGDLDEL